MSGIVPRSGRFPSPSSATKSRSALHRIQNLDDLPFRLRHFSSARMTLTFSGILVGSRAVLTAAAASAKFSSSSGTPSAFFKTPGEIKLKKNLDQRTDHLFNVLMSRYVFVSSRHNGISMSVSCYLPGCVP